VAGNIYKELRLSASTPTVVPIAAILPILDLNIEKLSELNLLNVKLTKYCELKCSIFDSKHSEELGFIHSHQKYSSLPLTI
jgi:hypothetical protein